MQRGLSGETLLLLTYLGLRSRTDMASALRKGESAISSACKWEDVVKLLQGKRWETESEVLDNGVCVSPDLLGEAEIVELKHVSPTSPIYDVGKMRRQVEVALARAAGREVDVVSLDGSPAQLRFEIARDGVVLLERKPFSCADFRARAMVDWWDWAPTARRIHDAAIERLRKRTAHGTP